MNHLFGAWVCWQHKEANSWRKLWEAFGGRLPIDYALNCSSWAHKKKGRARGGVFMKTGPFCYWLLPLIRVLLRVTLASALHHLTNENITANSPLHPVLSRGIWCADCYPNSRYKTHQIYFPSLAVGLGSSFLSGQRAWTWTGLCLVSLTPKGRKINPCASLSLNTWEIMKGRDSGCSCWGYFLQMRPQQ